MQLNRNILNIQKKITTLESISPRVKNFQFLNEDEETSNYVYHLFFLFVLLGINLFISWTHPNTAELMFLLISFCAIFSKEFNQLVNWYIVVLFFMTIKDLVSY